jgi:O-antigen/teichoic acid export membrane protein
MSIEIRRNTFYNIVGALAPAALSLIVLPLYIRAIGESRFGILALIWLTLGYFGIFDLGLGRAVAQKLASIGDSDAVAMGRVFWTSSLLNAGFGIFGGLLMWPVCQSALHHFTSSEASSEIGSTLPWLMLGVPLVTLSSGFGGALQGRGRFLELNLISTISSALIQIAPLCVAYAVGPNLLHLVQSVIFARLLCAVLLFWRCQVDLVPRGAPIFSLTDGRALLVFGGWVTVTSIVGPLMVILDRFVLGAVAGARAVTYYTVPFQLAQRLVILPSALSLALFPRMSAANGPEGRRLAMRALQSLTVVVMPMTVAGVVLIGPFLRLWIGQEFSAIASTPAQILLVAFSMNGLALVPFISLQARSRPDLIAKCHLAELVPYLIILVAALHVAGVSGAAFAFALRTFADYVLLMLLAGLLSTSIAILKVPVLLLAFAFFAAWGLSAGSVAWWFAVLVLFGLTLAWAWGNAPEEIREPVLRIWRRVQFGPQGASR